MYEVAAAGGGGPDGVLARVEDAEALADADLVRLLSQVEALGRRVDAARARLAGQVAHRSRRELGPQRLSARFGCRTPGELIQRATGISGATAGRRIRLGLATREQVTLTGDTIGAPFPAVAAALATGTLGVEAAHAIVTALAPTARVANPADVAAGEHELVTAAVETWGQRDNPGDDPADDPGGDPDLDGRAGCPVLDADTVRLQARVWAEFLDPDGTAPDDHDEHRRFLTLQAPRHGLVPITGLLLPEVAAALNRYADAWTNPRTNPAPDPTTTTPGATPGTATGDSHHSPAGAGIETRSGAHAHGEDPDRAPADPRSRAQLLHDILATAVAVAARAADAPSVAGNPPTLVVIAHEHDLLRGQGTAHTDDGTPLSITAARHIGCAGAIQRVSLDPTGRIVGLWSPERCFTGTQRRAITLRDRGCVIPGCHVPAAWCEVHHVTPHTDDPDGTHTDNGVLLCWHHHRTLDTSGWTIRMTDGLPWVRPPTWLDPTNQWRPTQPPEQRHAA